MGLFERLRTILSNYKSKPAVSTPVQAKEEAAVVQPKVYGNRGRLEIPELGISVPLYDTRIGNAQLIIDRQNSAVFLRWIAQNAIADHSDQSNFSNLNRVRVGATTMSIVTPNSESKYRCISSQVGHIKTTENGNRIYDAHWVPAYDQNEGGMCIYTCIARSAPDVMDIRLTYWQPVPQENE